MSTNTSRVQNEPIVQESRFARTLFAETGPAAAVWAVLRIWLGFEWLSAGWGKLTGPGRDAWLSGEAVQGFAAGALERGTGGENPAIAYGWYEAFLAFIRDTFYPVMGPMVMFGQIVIGVLLILGAFTGIAALLGVILNFSFIFAGTAGVNPMYLLVGLLLMLAWRNAGYFGLDRWLLPKIGTPFRGAEEPSGTAER